MANSPYTYVRLYRYVLRDTELTSTEKIVFCSVLSFYENHHTCYMSGATLARECGISESAVDKVLRSLREKRLVFMQRHESRKKNRYIIIDQDGARAWFARHLKSRKSA